MRIELAEADTLDATLTHWRGTLIWLGVAGMVALAIALLEALWPSPGARAMVWETLMVTLAFAALAAAFRFLYMPRRARAVHRRLQQRPYELEFDDEHLVWRSDTGSGGNPWSAFVKWREGSRVFLLYRSRTRFQIIPKKAFANGAAIDAFRGLLRRRIPSRKS
jgi:hypothetical protein